MKGKLPKSFSVCGQDFKIKYQKNINTENTLGLCKFFENEILVRTEFEGKEIPHDHKMQILCHEIIHSMLHVMNQHELNSNEEFVDSLAQVAWQVLKTIK